MIHERRIVERVVQPLSSLSSGNESFLICTSAYMVYAKLFCSCTFIIQVKVEHYLIV